MALRLGAGNGISHQSHLVGVLGRPDAEVLRVGVRGAHGRVRHLRNVIAERAIQCVGHLRDPNNKTKRKHYQQATKL